MARLRYRIMAGFSLILMFILFFFLAAVVVLSTVGALVLLIISLILFLQRKKAQNGKAAAKKGAAVTLLVIGCLLLIPLGITIFIIGMGAGRANGQKVQALESVENKIYVPDEWRDGFVYEGEELVPVNLFINDDEYDTYGTRKNAEQIGTLVQEDLSTYYRFYRMENDSGYEIYYVKVESFAGGVYYARTFVEKEDYDAVLDYYGNADLVVRALWKSAPADTGLRNNWETLDLNPEDKQEELFGLFHAVLDDVSDRRRVNTTREGYDECTKLEILSEDGILKVDLCVYVKGEEVALFLNEYEVESEIVETYREMLLFLTEEVQAELQR